MSRPPILPAFATITLTDDRGYTVCQFVKEKADFNWVIANKPMSEKALKRPTSEKTTKGDLAPTRLRRLPDGRCYLEAPGLYLRWEKVTPILDILAQHNILNITVASLRNRIG